MKSLIWIEKEDGTVKCLGWFNSNAAEAFCYALEVASAKRGFYVTAHCVPQVKCA